MKTAILLGFVLGFGGVLAGSHFLPWVAHARLPSQTSVVANGGRAEQFLIRLPVDRIGSAGATAGIRGSPMFANMALPENIAKEPLLIEHFKVRDSVGNVIGLAARHWSAGPDGDAGSAWVLMIPSRGALMLAAPGEPRGALDAALQKGGYKGASWDGDVRIDLAGAEGRGSIINGSAEFEGLDGEYSERWNVSGVSDTGELRGTIELNTVTFRGA
jgi:hypothetical protein